MPAQEQCLRDLVACGVCPQLNHAIAQAVADGSQQQRNQQLHDVSYTQMLAVLRSLPITDYSGQLEETLKTLLDAMRAAGDAEEVKKLASQVVGDKVSCVGVCHSRTMQPRQHTGQQTARSCRAAPSAAVCSFFTSLCACACCASAHADVYAVLGPKHPPPPRHTLLHMHYHYTCRCPSVIGA